MNDLRDLSNLFSAIESGDWREIEAHFNNSPQLLHMGIAIQLEDLYQPVCGIEKVENYHLGGIGQDYVNGGVISAVFDLSIGLTGLSFLREGHFATNQLNIHLSKPLEAKAFYAVSQINKQIGNTLFSESTLYNYKNEPCAYASGTVRIRLKVKGD